MLPFFAEKYGNPSSIHSYGREAKAALEKARKSIAQMLNAAPAEIFFTSGGTETANMIIHQAVHCLGVSRLITSRIEHHCVLHTADSLFRRLSVNYVDLDEKGNVQFSSLEKLLKLPGKALVCLMHANNEIGNITDIARVAEMSKAHGAYFFSDTVQTVAHYPIDLQKMPVHFISGSAHKFHGPKGVGFAFIRSDAMLKPMLHGGAQERNMRSGTENLAGIIGMEKAMSMSYSNITQEKEHVWGMKEFLFRKLKEEFPALRLNGNYGDDSLYTVLNVGFPQNDNPGFLIYNLDMNGISASAGSACSSGSDAGSHVLAALKVPENFDSVRFSFSRYNTREEIDYVVKTLREVIKVSV